VRVTAKVEIIDRIGASPYVPFKINTKASARSALWNKQFSLLPVQPRWVCNDSSTAVQRRIGVLAL